MPVKTSGDFGQSRMNKSKIMADVENAMSDSLRDGKELMVGYIETRGTMREWSRPWGSNGRSASIPGRDDTGQMKADVEGVVDSIKSNSISGWLGWDEGSPTYYALQENGFFHILTQQDVEGMYALRDAAEETEAELIEKIHQAVFRNL